jgi:hypothetical protein
LFGRATGHFGVAGAADAWPQDSHARARRRPKALSEAACATTRTLSGPPSESDPIFTSGSPPLKVGGRAAASGKARIWVLGGAVGVAPFQAGVPADADPARGAACLPGAARKGNPDSLGE